MIINPSEHDFRDIYKLLIGSIVPRPIAFVSTIDPAGVRNLAPFSFFTAVSANPPIVCFAPMVRSSDGSQKDSLRNIEATKEFVINIVSESFAEQMNICSTDFPAGVDEFKESGLTPVASDLVKPARVLESLVNMECSLLQIVRVSPKPLGGNLVLGEVIRFHIQDGLFNNFRIDPDLLKAIGRMGGPTYTRTADRFDLIRPKAGEIKNP